MISLNDINAIEFGITNRCNAGCPLCARHNYGTSQLHDNIKKLNNLDFEFFKKITDGLGAYSKNINADFVGTIGDCVMHPEVLEIATYASQKYNKIEIHTNGSARSKEFWTALGKLPNLKIVFSIDGLEDTHHLYRINTDYNKILQNAKTYIDAGGYAIWKFIKFQHNEHQVEEAKSIAKSLNFQKFKSIASARWALPSVTVSATEYKNKINKNKDTVTLNPSSDADVTMIKKYQDRSFQLDSINCRTISEGLLYIDEYGKLWPCCYFNSVYSIKHKWFMPYWKNIESIYGEDFNSLENNTIGSLLDHDYFANYLPKSFNNADKVCNRCIQVCSKNLEFQSKKSFKNVKLQS